MKYRQAIQAATVNEWNCECNTFQSIFLANRVRYMHQIFSVNWSSINLPFTAILIFRGMLASKFTSTAIYVIVIVIANGYI